jgi:hypothetical protein
MVLVVIVGTKILRAVPAEQDLVLGIMEPTTDLVYWQDFDLPTRPEHFNDEGDQPS